MGKYFLFQRSFLNQLIEKKYFLILNFNFIFMFFGQFFHKGRNTFPVRKKIIQKIKNTLVSKSEFSTGDYDENSHQHFEICYFSCISHFFNIFSDRREI